MTDRHTNSGPGEGELTTEDLARSGRDSRPDARSGPLTDAPDAEAPGTPSGAPSGTGRDTSSQVRSGPLSEAHSDRTADAPPLSDERTDRSADTSPPSYPGEATPAPERSREAAGERTGAPEEQAGQDRARGDERPRSVDEGSDPLIAHQEAEDYRGRWAKIQGTFVDDPKEAVRSADALVADVIQSLAATFADHKKDLEGQWSRGEQVETEGLRVALQQYRTFFNQLLDA